MHTHCSSAISASMVVGAHNSFCKMMHLTTTVGKSCEACRPGSIVRDQRTALGRWPLISNTYMLFDCHWYLPNCNCTQLTAQQDARDYHALLARQMGGGDWSVGFSNSSGATKRNPYRLFECQWCWQDRRSTQQILRIGAPAFYSVSGHVI